eukprot:4239064-Amphidinium_carterae.2
MDDDADRVDKVDDGSCMDEGGMAVRHPNKETLLPPVVWAAGCSPSSSLSSSELELSGSLTGMTSRGQPAVSGPKLVGCSQPSSSMVVIPSSAAGQVLPEARQQEGRLQHERLRNVAWLTGKLPDDSSSSAAMSSAMLVSDASKDSSSYIASEASSAPGDVCEVLR